MARTGEEAWAQVVAEYGEGHVISLWNEDDSRKPRYVPLQRCGHGDPSRSGSGGPVGWRPRKHGNSVRAG
jgi:hypothetical protein